MRGSDTFATQEKNHVCLPRRSRDRGLWVRPRDRNVLLSVPLWGPVWNIKGTYVRRSLTLKKTQSCVVLVMVLRRPDEPHTLTIVLSMYEHTGVNALHNPCVYTLTWLCAFAIDILCPNSHFTEWSRRRWRDSNMSQLLTNSPGDLWAGECTMTHSRNTCSLSVLLVVGRPVKPCTICVNLHGMVCANQPPTCAAPL